MLALTKNFFITYPLKEFKLGEYIIQPKESNQNVYYLTEGIVKMSSLSFGGQELTLNLFKPGSFFPMLWFLIDQPETYYYSAYTKVKAYQALGKETVAFLAQQPTALLDLTTRVFSGLQGSLIRMKALVYGKSINKLCSALFLLIERFGQLDKQGEVLIRLVLTHQELANFTGLTRETVSNLMKELKDSKVINYQSKKIRILNPNQLRKLAQRN